MELTVRITFGPRIAHAQDKIKEHKLLDNRISTRNVIMTLLVLVCITVIGFQAVQIKKLKASLFTFDHGDTLPQLELQNLDNNPPDSSGFSQGISVLLIFKTPCSSCNANLNSWNNLAKFFGDRINVLGIIPDGDPAAFRLIEEQKVNFPLYMPQNKDAFSRKMRLKLNMAQTIVVHNNKVKAIKIGALSAEDLNFLVSTIKTLISTS
jgi:peroxiredoxin